MRKLAMLRSHNVTPVMVFDGAYLPAKANKETERRAFVVLRFPNPGGATLTPSPPLHFFSFSLQEAGGEPQEGRVAAAGRQPGPGSGVLPKVR